MFQWIPLVINNWCIQGLREQTDPHHCGSEECHGILQMVHGSNADVMMGNLTVYIETAGFEAGFTIIQTSVIMESIGFRWKEYLTGHEYHMSRVQFLVYTSIPDLFCFSFVNMFFKPKNHNDVCACVHLCIYVRKYNYVQCVNDFMHVQICVFVYYTCTWNYEFMYSTGKEWETVKEATICHDIMSHKT